MGRFNIFRQAALVNFKAVILTADHGNCEFMKYEDGKQCPAHTTNPVVCMFITNKEKEFSLRQGDDLGLMDIAPTVLEILEIDKPDEMTGESLVE